MNDDVIVAILMGVLILCGGYLAVTGVILEARRDSANESFKKVWGRYPYNQAELDRWL